MSHGGIPGNLQGWQRGLNLRARVESLGALKPGTAVLLEDDWDDHKLKKAFILSKVEPTNPDANQYEVAFACSFSLSSIKTVKETFVASGGDVLPRTEWMLYHPAFTGGGNGM